MADGRSIAIITQVIPENPEGDDYKAEEMRQPRIHLVDVAAGVIRETLIQIAAEQYKQIGINVEAKTESFEALVDRLNTSKDPTYGDQNGRDFDAYVLGWSQTADPDQYQIWHSSRTHPSESNYVIYKNPDMDKAIEDSRTQCGQADRKAAFKRASQILNEDQPYNFGFARNILLGVNKKVQAIQPGSFARQGQAKPETWWVQ